MSKVDLVELISKTLKEINDKFHTMVLNQITQHRMEEADPDNSLLKDAYNESMLYLSSNWSAGGFSDHVFAKKEEGIDGKPKQKKDLAVVVPKIDIQKAIDYPRSDIDSGSKVIEKSNDLN